MTLRDASDERPCLCLQIPGHMHFISGAMSHIFSPVALSKCCVHRQQLEDNFWLANFSQIDLPIKESECLHPPQFPRGRPLSTLPLGVRRRALLLSAKVYSLPMNCELRHGSIKNGWTKTFAHLNLQFLYSLGE